MGVRFYVTGMVRRQHKVETDIDASGLVWTFLFGVFVGGAIVYPSLPDHMRLWGKSTITVPSSPIVVGLVVAVLMLLGFVLGVFILNWVFMEG